MSIILCEALEAKSYTARAKIQTRPGATLLKLWIKQYFTAH